ncbi:MAG: hypothetical protein SVY53_11185 [Chloroflexota bacterium]|nr:hypothetical protein [Chloroflexota bacterium]
MDIDWASDSVIDHVANILIKNGVKATWFATHDSAAVRELQSVDIFDIGLHPNFAEGSTQGENVEEIMTFLTTAFPDSNMVRMHGLIQSSPLLAKLTIDFGIKVDLSLLLVNTPNIVPHKIYYGKGQKSLLRIPYFWEDDVESNKPRPCWSLKDPQYQCKGLKVFNFHTIHIVLNSIDNESYENLKKHRKIQDLTLSELDTYFHSGKGCGTLFGDLVQYISEHKEGGLNVSDLVEEWG